MPNQAHVATGVAPRQKKAKTDGSKSESPNVIPEQLLSDPSPPRMKCFCSSSLSSRLFFFAALLAVKKAVHLVSASFTNRSMEKPFMCGVCKKPFLSFSHLTFHTQSHPSTPKCTVINGSFRPCPLSACSPRAYASQCDCFGFCGYMDCSPQNEFNKPTLGS